MSAPQKLSARATITDDRSFVVEILDDTEQVCDTRVFTLPTFRRNSNRGAGQLLHLIGNVPSMFAADISPKLRSQLARLEIVLTPEQLARTRADRSSFANEWRSIYQSRRSLFRSTKVVTYQPVTTAAVTTPPPAAAAAPEAERQTLPRGLAQRLRAELAAADRLEALTRKAAR